MSRLVGRDVVRIRIPSIKAKNIHFASVDETVATKAGTIKLTISDIPLADAIIAATAEIFTNSLVLTDDPRFQKINGIKFQWTEWHVRSTDRRLTIEMTHDQKAITKP